MRIFNGTEHEVNLYDYEDVVNYEDVVMIEEVRKLILREGALPRVTVEAGTTSLNCKKKKSVLPSRLQYTKMDMMLRLAPPIAIFLRGARQFCEHDPIPQDYGFEYDIIIVSDPYRSAVKELGGDTSRLAVAKEPVYLSEADKCPRGYCWLDVG
jgi:hypothetical protein